MLDSEKTKLFDPKRQYLSLGITEEGASYSVTPIFWESSAGAFSMKIPDVYISPRDLCDTRVMERIRSLELCGLYIYTPLDDYGFISEFTDLRDIHIRCAENIKNLDFLSEMHNCDMLFLVNANLSDIDVIRQVKQADIGIVQAFRYIGLYDCNIEKSTDFTHRKCHFTEFLVWSRPENIDRDRELWKNVVAGTKKYFPIS